MTTKFDNFVAALEQLCVEHGVDFSVDYDGFVEVWDYAGGLTETLIDCTKEPQ